MTLVYVFIGPLPDYTVESIFQARLFYDGQIILILDDMASPHLPSLRTMNVDFVPYSSVMDSSILDVFAKASGKIMYLPDLKGREALFYRSFERFFLVATLMRQRGLTDVFHLEVDNLLYTDPREWLPHLRKRSLAYMYDNDGRFSAGLFYCRDGDALSLFCDFVKDWIPSTSKFCSEMWALAEYYTLNSDDILVLPTHWPSSSVPSQTYTNFSDFQSLFDAAAIGVYLFGNDPFHTNGQIVRGVRNQSSAIDYTKYTYIWEQDEKERKIPYIQLKDGYIRINLLHIHSKDIRSALSRECSYGTQNL